MEFPRSSWGNSGTRASQNADKISVFCFTTPRRHSSWWNTPEGIKGANDRIRAAMCYCGDVPMYKLTVTGEAVFFPFQKGQISHQSTIMLTEQHWSQGISLLTGFHDHFIPTTHVHCGENGLDNGGTFCHFFTTHSSHPPTEIDNLIPRLLTASKVFSHL